jgi:hypothetical protein
MVAYLLAAEAVVATHNSGLPEGAAAEAAMAWFVSHLGNLL